MREADNQVRIYNFALILIPYPFNLLGGFRAIFFLRKVIEIASITIPEYSIMILWKMTHVALHLIIIVPNDFINKILFAKCIF